MDVLDAVAVPGVVAAGGRVVVDVARALQHVHGELLEEVLEALGLCVVRVVRVLSEAAGVRQFDDQVVEEDGTVLETWKQKGTIFL